MIFGYKTIQSYNYYTTMAYNEILRDNFNNDIKNVCESELNKIEGLNPTVKAYLTDMKKDYDKKKNLLIPLIKRRLLRMKITPSRLQTKDWRTTQPWYVDGRRNECEMYQRGLVEEITNIQCSKNTGWRINMETNNIQYEPRPMTHDHAFDWTEDIDGKQEYTYTIYYNFKMVCDSGGGQTRTLREVAHFIDAQLKYTLNHLQHPVYFANILDGDEAYKLYDKYNYILNKTKYKYVKDFVYIGDTHGFIDWFHQLNIQ